MKAKKLTKNIAPKAVLSADSLFLIRTAINRYSKELQTLHWSAVSFMGKGGTQKEVDARLEILKNIAHEQQLLTDANSQLCKLFEDQYKK